MASKNDLSPESTPEAKPTRRVSKKKSTAVLQPAQMQETASSVSEQEAEKPARTTKSKRKTSDENGSSTVKKTTRTSRATEKTSEKSATKTSSRSTAKKAATKTAKSRTRGISQDGLPLLGAIIDSDPAAEDDAAFQDTAIDTGASTASADTASAAGDASATQEAKAVTDPFGADEAVAHDTPTLDETPDAQSQAMTLTTLVSMDVPAPESAVEENSPVVLEEKADHDIADTGAETPAADVEGNAYDEQAADADEIAATAFGEEPVDSEESDSPLPSDTEGVLTARLRSTRGRISRAKRTDITPLGIRKPARNGVVKESTEELNTETDEGASASFSSLIQKLNHATRPHVQEQEAPEAVKVEPPAVEPSSAEHETPLNDLEMVVFSNVALEEQHASISGDPSPFTMHVQYGDGRVETSILGDTSVPGKVIDSDPDNISCFFRSCRRVIIPEVKATPLPDEGFWIPTHPVQRNAFHGNHDPATNKQEGADSVYSASSSTPVDVKNLGRILICWVGKVDISAALRHDTINPGPIRMLLEHMPIFDHVLLLTTQNQSVLDTLRTWLLPCLQNKTLDIQRTHATDLSDHVLVCQAAVQALEGLISQYNLPADGTGITMHLSPGSPVTHAIMLLLTTIRYRGATLMQTRLTGLGKAPDVLTISLKDILQAPGFTPETLPDVPLSMPATQFLPQNEPAAPRLPEMKLPNRGRSGRKTMSLGRGSRQPVRAKDILRRFKSSKRHSDAGHPSAHQFHLQESVPLELDMPVAIQEETNLRSQSVNIGRPSRISPTALQPKEGDPPLISSALGAVYKKMQRVSTMLLSILLLGESGSGKSRLARYLHEWSGRTGKFISLDCAGLTDEMFACELFGRPGGNGLRPREGAFRKARSGTLFLENVNLLTPTQQSMLLRVLAPVGETKVYLPARLPFPACTVRVRIIASSDLTLLSDLRAGRFRTDLYYRLAGVSTTLPSVREYSYDERENLLRSFLVALQQKIGQCWNFSGDAWQTLLDEKWPGNLREVSRILQQICLLSDSESTITREDVLQQLRQGRFANSMHYNDGSENPYAGSRNPFVNGDYGLVASMLSPESRNTREDNGSDASDAKDLYDDYSDDDYEDDDYEEDDDTPKKSSALNDFFVLGSGQNIDKALEQYRDHMVLEAMKKTNGNRVDAAAMLGLTTGQITYALQRIRNNEKNDSSGD